MGRLVLALAVQFAAQLAQLLIPDADKALEPFKHTNRLLFVDDSVFSIPRFEKKSRGKLTVSLGK